METHTTYKHGKNLSSFVVTEVQTSKNPSSNQISFQKLWIQNSKQINFKNEVEEEQYFLVKTESNHFKIPEENGGCSFRFSVDIT